MASIRIVETVGVGGVEQRDSGIERGADDGGGTLVIAIAGGRESHAAEAEHGLKLAGAGSEYLGSARAGSRRAVCPARYTAALRNERWFGKLRCDSPWQTPALAESRVSLTLTRGTRSGD
jgi:hypothetical protein